MHLNKIIKNRLKIGTKMLLMIVCKSDRIPKFCKSDLTWPWCFLRFLSNDQTKQGWKKIVLPILIKIDYGKGID